MLHFNFNTLYCSIDHQLLDWLILHNSCVNRLAIDGYSLYSSPLFLFLFVSAPSPLVPVDQYQMQYYVMFFLVERLGS